ncbi:MAG: ATP-binding cassette domain-containing protein [Methanomassiliicoccaceae archaeon]|nr:ATP-binding cassette domain-containing protein [Methanomassiliicoccaceae archaeon]
MGIIEFKDLKKSFWSREGGKKKEVEAVNGISLSIDEGEVFGFLGPNGAGKTTTQRMLATLLPIDSGVATIAGFDVKKRPNEVREIIGYVGQMGGTDNFATGKENLILQGRLYKMDRDDIEKSAERLIELFDLKDIVDRLAKTYSGGQKRRLEVALGLIHDPRILFLDEPTAGLDPQNRANLWNHIKELKQRGMTVLLTTHYLDEADKLCDRIAIIDNGGIVAVGTPKELKDKIAGETIKIEVETDLDTGTVAELFRDEPYVRETRTDGKFVHLIVDEGATALPKIFEILKNENITAKSISMAKPTLDDVFLKMTGRSLRD